MDIFPTLLDLAINKKGFDVDGKSYKKVLKNKDSWENRTVFWHSKKARPHSTGDSKASVVRSGDYKLIHFFEKDIVEVYNLKEDIGETNDLSKKEPKKTAELFALLKNWKKEFLVKERLQIMKTNPKFSKKKKKNKN